MLGQGGPSEAIRKVLKFGFWHLREWFAHIKEEGLRTIKSMQG